MTLQKTHWVSNGDKISMSMNFSKVDKVNRLVRGFATLDNTDRQGDQITHEANVKAFTESRKNLREMHDNIAAGKVVKFGEETFFDKGTNKSYKGIFVEAHVSEGAPNTWAKVLDGTLTGFSIGGNITESEPSFDKSEGAPNRIVKGYDLVELSLVDNPANQLANIFSVEKNDTGTFIKGMIADMKTENVFWCEKDEIAKSTADGDAASCGICGDAMKNIGYVETTVEANRDAGLEAVVSKYLSSEHGEGGVQKMVKDDNKDVVDTDAVVTSEDVTEPVVEQQVSDKEAKAETKSDIEDIKAVTEVVNVDQNDSDVKKMFSDLADKVDDSLSKSNEAASKLVDELKTDIEAFKKSYDEKFDNLNTKYEEISKSFSSGKTASDEVAKRLSALEGSTAIKKSGDVEVADETETKEHQPLFKGAFLGFDGLSN